MPRKKRKKNTRNKLPNHIEFFLTRQNPKTPTTTKPDTSVGITQFSHSLKLFKKKKKGQKDKNFSSIFSETKEERAPKSVELKQQFLYIEKKKKSEERGRGNLRQRMKTLWRQQASRKPSNHSKRAWPSFDLNTPISGGSFLFSDTRVERIERRRPINIFASTNLMLMLMEYLNN